MTNAEQPQNFPDHVSSLLPPEVRNLGIAGNTSNLAELTDKEITDQLLAPIWPDGKGPNALDLIRPGETTCVVVSDQTRRTGMYRVLPILLGTWRKRGIYADSISLLIATGMHRNPIQDELQAILGPRIYPAYRSRVFVHDPDCSKDLTEVGTNRRGHKVLVNRIAIEADNLVLTGTASYHYHAGFGGGRKALVPGLANRDTIAFNHSLSLDPNADRMQAGVEIGRLDGNPVAEEMLESARMCHPDILINSVLSTEGRIVGLFSGDLDKAHRAACSLVEKVSRVDLAEKADLVIASAGSARNWIQSHKALFNASRAVKDNGIIVLLAPCPEGLGNERFRDWVKIRDLPTLFRELRKTVEVNGQTALSTRMRGEKTILVTEMQKQDIEDLGIRTSADLSSAVKDSLAILHERGITKPSCWIMPSAMHTVPF